jgi:CDGSH-type Zn-finger protein/uncharacterized Fe-S cluster protein YjdI
MDDKLYEFKTDRITVRWSRVRCIHAATCIIDLPRVFDSSRRPWIDPAQAPPDEIARAVCRCPTGALHYERHDGGAPELTPPVNTVTPERDGPLRLSGDIRIAAADGTPVLEDTRVALCRCGATKHAPVCDGSHWEAGFDDEGRIGACDSAPAGETPGTPLQVTLVDGGPLWLSGPFRLGAMGGRAAPPLRIGEAWLCRCGRSRNKPFCDGSHAGVVRPGG